MRPARLLPGAAGRLGAIVRMVPEIDGIIVEPFDAAGLVAAHGLAAERLDALQFREGDDSRALLRQLCALEFLAFAFVAEIDAGAPTEEIRTIAESFDAAEIRRGGDMASRAALAAWILGGAS